MKRLFALCAAAALATLSTLAQTVISPTNSLVAFYPLDGSATDAGPLRLDGTLHGTSPTTDRFGVPGRALHFDGTSDFVDLGNRPEFNFPSNFTVSVWIKPDGFQAAKYVVGKYFSTGPFSNESHSYGLGTDEHSGSYGFVLGEGVFYTDIRGFTSLADGKWHFIALTYDQATGISLYTDGNLSGFSPAPHLGAFTNASPLMIGRIESGQHFAGSLDDVMILNRALTAEEIIGTYSSQSGTPGLDISRAVKLAFFSEPGRKYQLETTRDLVHWTPYRDPITAAGLTTAVYVDVATFPDEQLLGLFLRVRLVQ